MDYIGAAFAQAASLPDGERDSIGLAEEVGFEPTRLAPGCFQDNCLKPLGHLSKTGNIHFSSWQAGQESNLQPAVLETAALPN